MTTPLYGFGVQPAGVSSFGIGTPLGLPLPGNGYEYVNDIVAVREIDPATQDFVVDDDADDLPHEEITAMEQIVLLKLSTPRGQLAYAPAFGDDALNRTKAVAAAQIKTDAELALADEITTKKIKLVSVTVETTGGAFFRVVEWQDLSTRDVRTTRTEIA